MSGASARSSVFHYPKPDVEATLSKRVEVFISSSPGEPQPTNNSTKSFHLEGKWEIL